MLPPQYQQGPNAPISNRTQHVPVNNAPTYVDLNKDQKIGVSNLVSHQEKIFYAGVVPKVNKHRAAQNRILVITNKFLYNIDPEGSMFCLCSSSSFSVKRKININKIFGVTVSTNPTSELQQFVIHVKGEYDYLYNGGQKRERILKSLLNAHFANSTQPFVLYCRDEGNLQKFHTTDDDLVNKIIRRPKDGQILVTPDMAANGVEWIIFNRKNFNNKPPMQTMMNYNPGFHPNQVQPIAPGYPGPNNFPAPFPQNQNGYYPPQQHVPQWGNSFSTENQGSINHAGIPSYYIPEVQPQPQQYNFQPAPTNNVNVPYQYPQNINTQPQNTFSTQPSFPSQPVNQKQDDLMTMQAKKQVSNHDGSFTRNILPYNSGPSSNVQIRTNFDYAYPTGQQQQQNLPYNNYPSYNNNTQNQNGRGPYPY